MTNKTYMLTIPGHPEKGNVLKHLIKLFLKKHDIKDYIFAKEVGKDGYKHIQARIKINDGTSFENIKHYFPRAHVEECSDTWTYERKDGKYIWSRDTPEIRKVRFGKLRRWQRNILNQVNTQGIREIDVIADEVGNVGKSWLCNYLYETGRAYYVPPTIDTVKGIIQFVASGYKREKYIIIDIPRSWKWSEQLYTAIETIKDGIVYDTRYSATLRNIRGVKILVMTNTKPILSKLSADRWRIWDNEAITKLGERPSNRNTKRPLL